MFIILPDLKLSLTIHNYLLILFISSKYWRLHGKVAHVLVKKSVKLLWKDDPCQAKEQLLISEELRHTVILLSKNCSINLLLCRKGVKPMTLILITIKLLIRCHWVFGSLVAQKCYAGDKSFNGECVTTTEND